MPNELKLGGVGRSAAEEAELAAYQREFLDLLSNGNGEHIDPDFSGLNEMDGRSDDGLDDIFAEGADHAIVKNYRNGLPDNNILGLTSGEPYWGKGKRPEASTNVRRSICNAGIPKSVAGEEFFLDDDDLLEAGSPVVGTGVIANTTGETRRVIKRKARIREDI
jgi:hypothetical protein